VAPACGQAAMAKSSSPAAPRNNARAYLTRLSGSRRRRASAPHKAAKTGAASIRAADSIDVNHWVGISKAFTCRLTLRSINSVLSRALISESEHQRRLNKRATRDECEDRNPEARRNRHVRAAQGGRQAIRDAPEPHRSLNRTHTRHEDHRRQEQVGTEHERAT